MSKIIQLAAENVKRIRAVNITPSGNLVVVGGRNAQGKSSVLDSIAMALGGAAETPAAPIRNGEDAARVILQTEELTVRRTFSAAGGTSLIVTDATGKKLSSPQAILDKLTGKLTFDPMAFLRLPAKDQANALRKLVGLDFAELDVERARIYAERTTVNREVEQARAQLQAMPKHEGVPEAEQSATDLVAELQRANQVNADLERARQAKIERLARIDRICEEVAELEAKLADARKRLAESEAVPVPETTDGMIDVSAISQRLADLESTNAKVRANAARKEHVAKGKDKVAKADALTKRIEEIDAEKAKRLAEAPFPVPGLSFTDGGIAFNGVPLAQASSAEQMRVAVAIAAALNPALRVMLVRDGSLLDDDSLRLLHELSEQHNLQVWVERVGKGAECSVVIEDGIVEGAEPPPESKPEPVTGTNKDPDLF